MKRPLVVMAEGFVLGEVWLLLPGMWKLGALAALAVWVFLALRKNGSSPENGRLPFFGKEAVFFLFAVLGVLILSEDQERQKRYEQAAEELCGQAIQVEGRIMDIGSTAQGLLSVKLSSVTLYGNEEEYEYGNVLVYLDEDEGELKAGMTVAVWGELEAFAAARNPGQFDFKSYYQSLGFSGRIFGKKRNILDGSYNRYREAIRQFRKQAKRVLVQICGEEDLGLFQAITLGDKTELSDEIRKLYQDSGIAHLLAVSGLHISFIGVGFYELLRKLRVPRAAGLFAAAAVTVSYGVLTGGSASMVRAVLMVCFRFGAERCGRTYDPLSAMAFAALWLLGASPTLLFQAGFQLSFGAVLSLAGLCPFLEGLVKGDRRKRAEATALMSLSIHVVTCPMVVWHFFTLPLYGPFLNLAVIPLMGYVLMSGVFGILIGMPGGLFLEGGEFLLGMGHYILSFYRWICFQVQKLPGAVLFVGRPKLWQIAAYGGVWALTFGWLYFKKERRGRDKWAVLLMALLGSFWILQPLPETVLSVTFLDVGQGDGICIRTEDTVVLVDGGSADEKHLGEQVLEPFFKSCGIRVIDYAFVSHGDQDHISGLTWLLGGNSLIQIRHLVLPWLGQGEEAYETLCRLAEERGTEIHWMRAGDHLQAGAMTIRCLYGGTEENRNERNEHSLLLEVGYKQAGILLTGDMSEKGEKEWLRRKKENKALENRQIQLLKTAHHGSASSTSVAFLEAVRPGWAVISCGKGNSYGHPSPETLRRFSNREIPYICTLEVGAVMVTTDGTRMKIKPFLDP